MTAAALRDTKREDGDIVDHGREVRERLFASRHFGSEDGKNPLD
jgi:hypothetical protein